MPPDPPIEKRASQANYKNYLKKKAWLGNACSPALRVPEQLPYTLATPLSTTQTYS